MAIQIKEESGVHKILGNLNSQSKSVVFKHFRLLLKTKKKLVISLEEVLFMDHFAAKSLEKFYKETVRENKILCLSGKDNKKITKVLLENGIYYLFNQSKQELNMLRN